MLENEEKTEHNSGEVVATSEPQASMPPAAKRTRKAKPAAGEEATPAEAKQSASIEEVVAIIKGMTVLELAQLVKTLEAEFGVIAATPVLSNAATATPAQAPAPAAEEQTEFTVTLKSIGPNKISVIKAVRELTSLGLKESKDLVEGAPKPVKEKVGREEAAAAKQKLEEAGATAEVS